ncbi:MAG TPA: hypothetical protein VFT34_17740 [Verrucomicrobiae bacterium]|nr:hypothetical protein [Verrucomicrobiae bacterium]
MDKAKPDNSRSGIRPGVIFAVAVVIGILIAGKFAGWFGGQKQGERETAAMQAPPGAESASLRPAPVAGSPLAPGLRSPTPVRATPSGTVPGTASTGPGTRPASAPLGAAAVPDAAGEMPDWNDKLDTILGSNEDEARKAEQLLALWPTLPEEGQVETMQHISNLLPDEKFSLLSQTLTNAATSEAVLDIIMGDALNRPNALKLPSLLEVAKVPGHPKAEEALEILEVFVDHNYGSDWAQWDKAVKDWLKENPDEPEDGK